jgi:hypothetical protein
LISGSFPSRAEYEAELRSNPQLHNEVAGYLAFVTRER